MATTFKAVVYADNRRKDGTYNVKIRVTHNRRSLKVATNLYVIAEDMTRGLKLKDEDVIDQSDELIKAWRSYVNQLGVASESMDVKQVVEYIKDAEQNGNNFKLDFIAYGRDLAKKIRRDCPDLLPGIKQP